MKIVITGGPGTGKTSVINYFKNDSQEIIGDVEKEIVNRKKVNLEKISDKEFKDLQNEILEEIMKKEAYADHYDNMQIYFMDKSLIDINMNYKNRFGKLPKRLLRDASYDNKPLHKYHKVFVLEPSAGMNKLDRDKNNIIHQSVIKAYKNNKYEPIVVPKIETGNAREEIVARGEFIKNNLLGLDTINQEYEKLQEHYNSIRCKYNMLKSLEAHMNGESRLWKEIITHLASHDYSW